MKIENVILLGKPKSFTRILVFNSNPVLSLQWIKDNTYKVQFLNFEGDDTEYTFIQILEELKRLDNKIELIFEGEKIISKLINHFNSDSNNDVFEKLDSLSNIECIITLSDTGNKVKGKSWVMFNSFIMNTSYTTVQLKLIFN